MKLFSSFQLSVFGASCAGVLALVACGGISDPSKSGDGSVATIAGALTGGNVPANARVALVWRDATNHAYAVGNDVAVVDGAFSMALTAPNSSYLFDPNDASYSSSESDSFGEGSTSDAPESGGGTPIPIATDAGAAKDPTASPSGGGFSFTTKLQPRDGASGTIGKPIYVGVAGFVVYLDTNGNGKLDIAGQYAKSTDEIIGGSSELVLAYFKDGSTLDYEKMRDDANSAPKAGFNLLWTGKDRWLPLNAVDLALTSTLRLPSTVCSVSEVQDAPDSTTQTDPSTAAPDEGTGGSPGSVYPSPDDPNLYCAPDGSYFSYGSCSMDSAPLPEGLCAPDYGSTACAKQVSSLPPDGSIPEGWPCPVNIPAAEDAGAPGIDASFNP